MVIPQNIYTSNIVWSQKVILRNTYVCTNTFVHAIIINWKKEAMNLEESREGHMGRCKGRKWKRER